jgi:uncharacterized protein
MLPLIERHQPAIAELCKQHGVDRLYVFGSVLRPDYRPGLSDLDFLVDFQPMSPVRNPIIAREIAATRQQIYGA